MAAHDGKMYFGIYPNAQIWVYDPAQAFGADNPKELFDLKSAGQERPWTLIDAGPYLAIGTTPKNSQTSGAVTLFDPATGEHRTWNTGLVDGANQISSLAYRDGVLYGGSLGCCNFDGTKSPGQIFAMDAASGSVLWRSTPFPDEQGVNGLTFDGQGRLFGMTYGTVFEVNPATGALIRSVKEFDYNWATVTNFQPRAVNMTWTRAMATSTPPTAAPGGSTPIRWPTWARTTSPRSPPCRREPASSTSRTGSCSR